MILFLHIDGRVTRGLMCGSAGTDPMVLGPWVGDSAEHVLDALVSMPTTPDRVIVVTAVDEVVRAAIQAWMIDRWRLEPEYYDVAAVTAALAAVAWPGQRDRAGVVAYLGDTPCAQVVADAGVVVDLCWLPGEQPVRQALYAGTSDIAARAATTDPLIDAGFGQNTAGAIQQGTRMLWAAAIEDAVARAGARLGRAGAVLLTGPAAGDVLPLLSMACRLDADLVLRAMRHRWLGETE